MASIYEIQYDCQCSFLPIFKFENFQTFQVFWCLIPTPYTFHMWITGYSSCTWIPVYVQCLPRTAKNSNPKNHPSTTEVTLDKPTKILLELLLNMPSAKVYSLTETHIPYTLESQWSSVSRPMSPHHLDQPQTAQCPRPSYGFLSNRCPLSLPWEMIVKAKQLLLSWLSSSMIHLLILLISLKNNLSEQLWFRSFSLY